MISLIMDGIVALLLIATIAFAIRLNTRLGTLNKEREAMERLVSGLHTASRQAEEAVAELKAAALENGQNLQNVVEKAAVLKLDLEFMVEKGTYLADRLESGLKGERYPTLSSLTQPPAPVLSEVRSVREEPSISDRTSNRLAAILKNADNFDAQSQPQPQPQPQPRTRPQSVADNWQAKEMRSAEKTISDSAQPVIPESRAERDLKRALEARR